MTYAADRQLPTELQRLRNVLEKMQISSKVDSKLRTSYAEVPSIILEGTTAFDANIVSEPPAIHYGTENCNVQVAEWVYMLESLHQESLRADISHAAPNIPSGTTIRNSHDSTIKEPSEQRDLYPYKSADAVSDESDDDFNKDLAQAALDTGTVSFKAQDWDEADSLLQEALRGLQQLPKRQREFCDLFSLHYKLAICAYHLRDSTSENALTSFIQQPTQSDEQRGCIYEAKHLLSQLYIRIGQVERAKAECEKSLQARRRLLGKQSDPALESTALMAHIYFLLNNRARAKSCLAMIPETRREGIIKLVEESLGVKVEHLDFSSLLIKLDSDHPNSAATRDVHHSYSSSIAKSPMADCSPDSISNVFTSSAASRRHSN